MAFSRWAAPMFGVAGDRIGHRDLLAMMRATSELSFSPVIRLRGMFLSCASLMPLTVAPDLLSTDATSPERASLSVSKFVTAFAPKVVRAQL